LWESVWLQNLTSGFTYWYQSQRSLPMRHDSSPFLPHLHLFGS
jgi:hypothetical protein